MTSGAHLLIECLDCAPAALDSARALEQALERAAQALGARVISRAFHIFEPQGVTGFLLLEESHISIHTWPERGYAAVDLYTCGAGEPTAALAILREALGAGRLELLEVRRGQLEQPKALAVVDRR